MKVWMLWHGGSSYAMWNAFNREDIDECSSIKEAVELFDDRLHNRLYDPETPCVDETATAWLCFSDPYQNGDVYPDRIISIGPRGGIRVERG